MLFFYLIFTLFTFTFNQIVQTTYGPNKSQCLADTPYETCVKLSSCCYASHYGENQSFKLCVNIFYEENKSAFCKSFVEEVRKEGYSPLACECKDYIHNIT